MTGYTAAMKTIDTVSALSILGLEATQEGSYAYYVCPSCGGKAVARTVGEKKNLIYCIPEKKSGHIISLAM
ncbi:MAG: hypothetical protein HQK58_04455, partial [Deltaproteobacteria bacterium]|nr:hypothetical protein [Deltaproteobacteria bacterium]